MIDPAVFEKGAEETLDFSVSFNKFLTEANDVIESHEVELDPGVTLGQNLQVGTEVRMFVSGGDPGTAYEGQVVITTDGGRILTQDVLVIVR